MSAFTGDFDEAEIDEGGTDLHDFSHFLSEDESRAGFAMIALKAGYEMIERGEDQGTVAEAIVLLCHEAGIPDAEFNIFDWASDYFENVAWEDFMNAYVSSPAEGLYSEEEADQIRESMEGALEQVIQEAE